MPNPRGALVERLGNWLTGKPAPPPSGQDLTRAVTRSVPTELITRLRQRPYDPKIVELFQQDSLARQKGWAVYEQMQDDSQVRAVTTIKRYAPTSNGWKLHPADESSEAAQIADFCRDTFLNMEKTLEEIVGQVLESTFTGMSISETLYRVERRGTHKNKIMLADVQTRPPSMVDVDFDGSGKIIGILQSDTYGGWNDVGMHPFKFIVHTWQGRYGSPYGRGDGRAVHRHWWSKEFLMRSWAAYMDKFGAPSIIGRQAPNMSQEDVDNFQALLSSIQHEGTSVLPTDWTFDWLFPPGGSANAQAFLTAIEWHDSQIALAVLGSTLSTNENRGTGSFAQAKVHEDTRDLLLRRVKTEAETTIVTRQMLRRLVRLNFGQDAAMTLTPKFIFSPPDLEEVKDLATIIQGLVTAKVISADEPWIRERLYIPAHTEVHEAASQVAQANAEKDNAVATTVAQGQLAIEAKKQAIKTGLQQRTLQTQHQLGQQSADAQVARDKVRAVLGHVLSQRSARLNRPAPQVQAPVPPQQTGSPAQPPRPTAPAAPSAVQRARLQQALQKRLSARANPQKGQ